MKKYLFGARDWLRITPCMNAPLLNVFIKMGYPRPLFRSFQANYTNFTTIDVKKCHDHIRCRDLNPQPLENELPP